MAKSNVVDSELVRLIKQESERQSNTVTLIPSENYTSAAVRDALGSHLTNKYSEGYAHKRYYQGNDVIDQIEDVAIERAKKLFGVPYVNVQPYSGSPANSAVYFALLSSGDTIVGLKLSGGGHLTHGHPDITFSGKYFHSVQYDVDQNGYIDLDEVQRLVSESKPKIVVVGTTAYPRVFDWKKWREIADSVGAYLLADISHIAGLVVSGVHPSPVPYVDVIMTTTHKTLRGPRGAMIMVTDIGLSRDAEMGNKIDKAVFPGLQGGPHDNVTAGIAIALHEASQPEYKAYGIQVVENAKVLATTLLDADLSLTTGGTENHLMVLDLQKQGVIGNIVAEALEVAGIVVNKNSVPHDPNPPFYPSGIRIGTPAVTTRGMKEEEMKQIAKWIVEVIREVSHYRLPETKEGRKGFLGKVKQELSGNARLLAVRKHVEVLCSQFPIS